MAVLGEVVYSIFQGRKGRWKSVCHVSFHNCLKKMSFCFDNQPQVHKIKKKKIHRINSRTIKGENEF